ncbi:MAG: GcrA family cell cycle regulator [Acetobacteraceae bacterium]
MEWTDETITRLRALWDEGHSTAEIGRRLGVSKNAVVGKAHRLDLSARPSPIRPSPDGPRPRPPARRGAGPTLPPLASTRPMTSLGALRTAGALAMKPIGAPARQPIPAPPRLQAVAPPRYGRVITCCWPLGEPGTKTFHFCDAESVPGKPYCTDHAELAYVKIRDRREDAA